MFAGSQRFLAGILAVSAISGLSRVCAAQTTGDGWPTAGGDPGGQRYSSLTQINRQNVGDLSVAWTYHTGAIHWVTKPDGSRVPSEDSSMAQFESTPILFNGLLYVVTPRDAVIALDPVTGQQQWRYDYPFAGALISRGIAPWQDSNPSGPCGTRVFLGTLDAQLLALDGKTGQLCEDFGSHGSVDLRTGVDYRNGDYYSVTSPPTVVGNVVIVGSGIQDNDRVDVEKGDVRGYDAHTGKLVWTWDPIPWAMHQQLRTGAGNAWSYISADPEHGLVYVPTGSASPDFYGGMRPGDNRDADSVVALEAATGKRVWGFQTTHHNLWDYDVASQPLLFTLHGVPAVAVTTKMGMVFVLNRLSGEPLYPVVEKAVPQTDVPGEITSPTQPFSSLPSLSPLAWPADVMWSANPDDDRACRKLVDGLRHEGIYTPPSLRGSLLYPGNLGGVNWGSPAFDPATGILYADTNHYAFSIKLLPRGRKETLITRMLANSHAVMFVVVLLLLVILLICWRKRSLTGGLVVVVVLAGLSIFFFLVHEAHVRRGRKIESMRMAHFGAEAGPQTGTPYEMFRQPLLAPDGKPCTPQPWGTISAINLYTGKPAWDVPLGTLIAGQHTGTLNLGGPIVTAGGLVFTAASTKPYLSAFDSATGAELWKMELPVPAQSTPMTYQVNGRQYLVVSAGGHGGMGTPLGDSVIAYTLK